MSGKSALRRAAMSPADDAAHCPCGRPAIIVVSRFVAVSLGWSLKRAASSQGSTPIRASADRAVRTMPLSSSPIGAYKKSLNVEVRSENTECGMVVDALIGSRICAVKRITFRQYGRGERNVDRGEGSESHCAHLRLRGGSARLSRPQVPGSDSIPRYFHKWERIGPLARRWSGMLLRFHDRIGRVQTRASSRSSTPSSSVRARDTRLFMVPTGQPAISAALS